MDYGSMFSQAFQQGMENKNKLKMLNEQASLDNQSLTPEQKLMITYKNNPKLFTDFRKSLNPYEPMQLSIQRALADTQQYRANTDAALANDRINGDLNATTKQRDYKFLTNNLGLTQEQALKYLYPSNNYFGNPFGSSGVNYNGPSGGGN